MGDFILKYWVEFALGVVATGLGIFCRRIWKMYTQEKDRKRSAEHEELKNGLTEIMQTLYKQTEVEDAQLQKEIDALMDTNKEIVRGLLSVQSN